MRKSNPFVPIVQQDLSHEETILQIAFALDNLQKIVSDIFSNVGKSFDKQNKRLEDIQNRSQRAKMKVEKLKGITKSIQVFSPYKFPGPSIETFYSYNFVTSDAPVEDDIKIKYSPLTPDKLSLAEKSNFYHIKDSTQLLRRNDEVTPRLGLGKPRKDIKSVSSLLLFNTSQNIFTHYTFIDPLSISNKFADSIIKDTGPDIEPAPSSINSNEPLGYRHMQAYFYSPSMQDVPDINAPLDLPHLPGIAGDLRFSSDIGEVKGEVVKAVESKTEQGDEPLRLAGDLPKLETSDNVHSTVIPPPPPLVPPPPPPPPPEDPKLPLPPTLSECKVTRKKEISPDRPDMRANLMEAIRQAGGTGKAKLKHVTSDSPTKPANQPQGNMSLMDDLHAKLSMRRKGISGKADNPEGILERIVYMIPQPPPKEIETETDDEWDD